jgi:hypothetical protein
VLQGLTIAVAGIVIGEVLAIPAIRALASVQPGFRRFSFNSRRGRGHLAGSRLFGVFRAR